MVEKGDNLKGEEQSDKEKVVEKAKASAAQNPKRKHSKKFWIILCSCIGAALIAAAVIICLIWKPWEGRQTKEVAEPETVAVERVSGTDYNQKITKENGEEFSPKITEGATENLAMRFSELSCEEDCKNVENLKFGDKTLKLGEDYELKKGSVIVIIYAKVFSGLEPGEVTVTFEITEDNKILTIGVKITIEKKEEEKKEEKKAETQANPSSSNAGTANSQTSNSAAPAVDSAKVACEARTDGPIQYQTWHFPSSAEKKEWIAQNGPDYEESEVAALMSWFGGSSVPMHYINGVCRPSISSATDWIGVGAQPISEKGLKDYGITLRKDFIRWVYADGRVEDTVTTDFNSPWSW